MHDGYKFPERSEIFSVACLLAVVCIVVFFASLSNNFVSLDDNILIYSNSLVKTPFTLSSLGRIFTSYDPELYVPLTFLTYKAEHLFFGLNPSLYHFTSLLLHFANAIFVYLFIYLLSQRKWLSVFVAIFFVIHPVNVEAVAWATGRKDVLSAFFFFISLLLYLRYRENDRRSHYVLSIAAFALALMSKVSVLLLPFVLILLDWRDGRKIDAKNIMNKVPYFSLTVLFGLIATLGKTDVLANSTLWEKFLMSMKSTVFSLQNIVFPTKFSPIYPYNGTITLSSSDFFVPLMIVVFLLLVVLYSRKWTRETIFGVGFFFLLLIPSFINFSKDGSIYIASDRYIYISLVGLLYLVGIAVQRFLDNEERYHAYQQRRMSILTVLLILGGVFAVSAHAQSLTWRDSESLYVHVLENYPDSFHAQANLASYLFKYSDRLDEAEELYLSALELQPENATIINNLGILYRSTGREQQAMTMYEKAIELKPNFVEPYYSIGILHTQSGRIDLAIEWYGKALEIAPDHVKSHINLAAMYSNMGEIELAQEHFQSAIDIDPTTPEPYYNLGILYEKQGLLEEALASYEKALRFNPKYLEAYNNIGALYLDLEEYERAASYFEKALKINPSFAPAKQNMEALRPFIEK